MYTTSSLLLTVFFRFLAAYILPVTLFLTLYTLPNAPLPIILITSYLPVNSTGKSTGKFNLIIDYYNTVMYYNRTHSTSSSLVVVCGSLIDSLAPMMELGVTNCINHALLVYRYNIYRVCYLLCYNF